MWNKEATAYSWPEPLRPLVSADQTSVRLRAQGTNGWVFLFGPGGLLFVAVELLALASERSVATLVGLVFAAVFGVLWVGSSAYVLFGHMDITHADGGWRVETVLGPFHYQRSFSRFAVRFAQRVPRLWVATPGTAGPHIELELSRERPVRIGAGFYLDEPVLAALAKTFEADLIDAAS